MRLTSTLMSISHDYAVVFDRYDAGNPVHLTIIQRTDGKIVNVKRNDHFTINGVNVEVLREIVRMADSLPPPALIAEAKPEKAK